MIPKEQAEQILTLHAAGWSGRAIAQQLGHAHNTVRDYVNGRRIPGTRADSGSDLFTDLFASYCRQRLIEDPHLRRSTLFKEATDLGFQGSRSTFYRGLTRHLSSSPSHAPAQDARRKLHKLAQQPVISSPQQVSRLPRSIAPLTGEELRSYLTRLAHANHLTLTDLLSALPIWFSTKINNRDDRAQHHMLAPATTEALNALSRLTGKSASGLSLALPAFAADANTPARATSACHRCAARHGIHEPIPIHLPVHQKVCIRHGIWLSETDQHHLDLSACPEIITAQLRADRLLRRHTAQQLLLAQQAAARAVPLWPTSPTSVSTHWRHRLLTLQTANHHLGIATDGEAYTHAARYPDVVALTAESLNREDPKRS